MTATTARYLRAQMRAARRWGGQRGVTLIEMLVAVGIFALFIMMVDVIFLGANRSARKAELAADVQQNARIAIERLTREIRESNYLQVLTGGSAGEMWVVFKSPRLPANNTVFCLYNRSTSDPPTIYNPDCYTFPAGNLAAPPYSGPPFPAPCDSQKLTPCGTYSPIWQRYVGYYVTTSGGVKELRRVTGQLDTPGQALSSSMLTGGDVIATRVDTFDVSLVGGSFTATLRAKGTEFVQGSQLPVQQMLLPGTVTIRN